VIGVANVISLTTLLDRVTKNEYNMKILNKVLSQSYSSQNPTSTTYTSIVKKLQVRNTDFHIYKMKEERSFKIVLKNVHQSRRIKTNR